MVQSSGGVRVGDPVQLIGNPRRVGKVVAFCTPIAISAATDTDSFPMPYVHFPGSVVSEVHDLRDVRVCKCVDRLPKGVSKC